MDSEELFHKKMEEINKKMDDPKISDRIDELMSEVADLIGCDVELNFKILPFADEYTDEMEDEDWEIPKFETITVEKFAETLLKDEENRQMDMYIDPIYLKKGVNNIVNVLVTNVDDKLIVVPITTKNETKL